MRGTTTVCVLLNAARVRDVDAKVNRLARGHCESRSHRSTGPRMASAGLTLLLAATVAPAGAASITDKLHRFIDTQAFPVSGAFIDVVTPVVERLAVRGIDFPVTATTPG